MIRVFKAFLKVAFYFLKEKVFRNIPPAPLAVWVVTDIEGAYLVRICKEEAGALECCKGMEQYYKYEKHEL